MDDADKGHTNSMSGRPPAEPETVLSDERFTSVGGRSQPGAVGDGAATDAAAAVMSMTPTMSSMLLLAALGLVHHAVTTGCTATGGVRSGGNGPGGKSSMAADATVLVV